MIIIKCLDLMLKQSLLYCDFKTFVEKISPKKNIEEIDDEKTLKMNKSDINEKGIFNIRSEDNTPIASFKINNY